MKRYCDKLMRSLWLYTVFHIMSHQSSFFYSLRIRSLINALASKATLFCCSFLLIGVSASANVQYTFTSTSAFNGMPIGSFQVTVPTFINSLKDIGAGELDACTISAGACGAMSFLPDPAVFGGTGDQDVIGFGAVGFPSALYYFENQAFRAYGMYSTVLWSGSQAATLVVMELTTPTGTVPEPGVLFLLFLGLVSIALTRKERRS